MRIVGLVTEYNPFHNGHQYHLDKAKEVANADYAVVVMSGNFVQRGTPAVTDKYLRTKMALLGGCDLVLELPVRYATSSAEGFALGAIAALSAANCVDGVCFGSECGDIDVLKGLGRFFIEEPEAYRENLMNHIKSGDSFPLARRRATLRYYQDVHGYGEKECSKIDAVLSSPNNILGIEYVKAIERYCFPIKPFTVLRKGAPYHGLEMERNPSASGIRTGYQEAGNLDFAKNGMPHGCFELLKAEEGVRFPIVENDFSDMLYYAMVKNIDHLQSYADVSEDLAYRMKQRVDSFTDWEGFAALLKTKQYTLTRIYRCFTHILLGLGKNVANNADKAPYLRVLGLRRSSSQVLKRMREESQAPIITKLSEGMQELTLESREIIEEDRMAAQIYNRALFKKFGTMQKNEYQNGMVVVP